MFVGPFVVDKRVNFHDPRLNSSGEIPPKPSEAVFSTVSPYNFRLEVDNDVISGTGIDNVGMDVPVKFGDSRSNGFRNIRGADFTSNERTNIGEAYTNSAKRERVSANN